MSAQSIFRRKIRELRHAEEHSVVRSLIDQTNLTSSERAGISANAARVVEQLRAESNATLMELFLAEYGLSSDEGIALMTLAEAYLRTPDAASLGALIKDKIGSGDWQSHTGNAHSALINVSTWALMLTGRLLEEGDFGENELSGAIQSMVRRLGEPVVRKAVEHSMKFLGSQFVFGRSISEALKKASDDDNRGLTFSFDMLGEAARTTAKAQQNFRAYSNAIVEIGRKSSGDNTKINNSISVKLSALHPRYEWVQRARIMNELVPLLTSLSNLAKANGIGLTVDAEESNRLELYLDVIEATLRNSSLKGWDGFGIAVQAYLKEAAGVIDWFYSLADELDRHVTLRLVKGAYWDYEIKFAQQLGLANYTVFTKKEHTDISYQVCAQKLFAKRDRIYIQFATHNALTMSAILQLAGDHERFEFQRLHGMGEELHDRLGPESKVSTRVYAPVGVHEDLLAYLVRRLLENGANSSFVNQLLDEDIAIDSLVADPIAKSAATGSAPNPVIPLPAGIFGSERLNSAGIDLNDPASAEALTAAMESYKNYLWQFSPPHLADMDESHRVKIANPGNKIEQVGSIPFARPEIVGRVVPQSAKAFEIWRRTSVEERSAILEKMACALEDHMPELIALTTREAGKTRLDGVLEVREAVDFCRYYASEARRLFAGGGWAPRGPVVCISPWNFPLAIFVGQIAAALVAGNSVIAKPAEQTPLIAWRAVELFHDSGVPQDALILLPGDGQELGGALTGHPAIQGVCFTGSLQTAQAIDRNVADKGNSAAFLIFETGGLNAMIVDSTALPEQAVRDIVSSAFQSAGQRCSALRVLFIQEDVQDIVLDMLKGAVAELAIGDPWNTWCDVGPVIDDAARNVIDAHCFALKNEGRLIFEIPPSDELASQGTYVPISGFRLDSLDQLKEEIFGPVLHVVSFPVEELDQVVVQINSSGYGLTLGIHSRINTRVDRICGRVNVGNIYVNRNQIGAVVGVQPFGGMGLSGTGPKAGGPHYLRRFVVAADRLALSDSDTSESSSIVHGAAKGEGSIPFDKISPADRNVTSDRIRLLHALAECLPIECKSAASDMLARIAEEDFGPRTLVSPTGETNVYLVLGRGPVLCLGDDERGRETITRQVFAALGTGCRVILPRELYPQFAKSLLAAVAQTGMPAELLLVVDGSLDQLLQLADLAAVIFDGSVESTSRIRRFIAHRPGPRLIHIQSAADIELFCTEKLISTDTTASGGNATLMMATV